MRLLDDGLWILESFNNILNGVFLSSSGLSPPFFSSSFGRVSNIIITIIEITAIIDTRINEILINFFFLLSLFLDSSSKSSFNNILN